MKGDSQSPLKYMALVKTSRVPFIECPRRDQIFDLVFSLLLHPGVDGLASLFGCGLEIDFVQPGTVVGLGRQQEILAEVIALLTPQGIGHMELVAVGFTVSVEVL